MKNIRGFSKLSKDKKINWICENFFNDNKEAEQVLKQYWNENSKLQKLHDDFSENVVSNYCYHFQCAKFYDQQNIYAVQWPLKKVQL